uniref:Integrase catalytic domain-containing protein n=1 Tax=Tanacetum cinerariifolium TaxID=118510 RepID=A0A6L2KQ87_TANCI|nr:hypothetical protein [Tanacetum cinerariifolium]
MESLSPQVVSATKLPILNPNEFDLWKMRIEQYFLMTDYSLWEVILNGDSPAPTRVVEGVLQPLKFNSHKDAKTLMKAIEKRFGGNTRTKKVQKTLLKQQCENFTGSSSESLDQIHDRLQKLVSQLEIHGVSLSQEDVNLNLKIYEAEVKSSSSAGTTTRNIAFVSSSNTDSTTEPVSAAASVFAVCAKMPVYSFPNVESLSNARTGRNLRANGPTSLGFDMSKVECYNYHRKGHFARECRSLKDSRRNGAAKPQRRNVLVETSTSNALVSQCDGVGSYDWSFQAEEEPANYALMDFSSLSSSSDNESDGSWPPSFLYDRFQSSDGYHVVPPPYTGTFMPPKPDLVFTNAPNGVETDHSAFHVKFSLTEPNQDLSHLIRPSAPIIEDWVSDSEDESKTKPPQTVPSFVQSTEQVKSPRHFVQHVEISIPAATPKPSKPVPITVVRPVSIVVPKTSVPRPKQVKPIVTKPNSPKRMHITCSPSPKASNLPLRVNAVKAPVGNPQHALKDKGVIDSGCSRHMTRNMSYLSDFEELNGGYVSFGGNPNGGKISGKGKIQIGKLDFDDVYYVKELKFNLFSVSHMCDKKNSVLFTDTECLVLSPGFKLPDESQVLLRVPRENNMYNNNDLNRFCGMKGIKREFSVPRTLQQNGIAKRKNMTLIEAAKTMLADSLLPIPFWVEAVNTACYVQNRVLVPKPHNKIPYELLHGRTPSIGFMRPFGCHVTILNILDSLGSGPTWLFDIDSLTKTMNYQPVTAGNQSNPSAGFQDKFDAEKAREESDQQYVLFPVWSSGFTNPQNTNGDAAFDGKEAEFDEKKSKSEVNVSPSSSSYINEVNDADTLVPTVRQISPNNTNTFSAAGPSNTAASPTHGKSSFIDAFQLPDDPDMPESEDITYSGDEDDVGAEADFNNLETSITVSPIPTTRVHKDHPVTQIIGDLSLATQTRSMTRVAKDQEPKRVHQALKDPSWIEAMHEELLQFKMQKVWILVNLPHGKRAIGTKWVFKNKKDERGIMVRNKARLVAQGHTQEEGIDYEEVFALVARIESIRLFLAYASYMGFMVYQMGVKSAFLYGTIEREVYVCQPPGFEDPDHPDKVYKVVKALYGLHQALRAWQKWDILLVQIYVDDIIFGATNKDLCKSFEKLMKDKFQTSLMGELTFFLGLQVKQKKDGIFISHDKYIAEILRKFRLTDGKLASTPIDTKKPLLKDPDGEDVDVHTYRSMIGSLMYLTSSRPDIMFAVCACVGVNTPRCDEDRLELMELTVFLLPKVEKVGIGVSAIDLQVYAVRLMLSLSIKYALTVNPNIYVSCIKQFWTTVAVKKVNDVIRLQALVDKKKVVVTEATIRKALHLDDAEGVECLLNEEIFAELAIVGYEKPSTKLTFYKAFFSSQWKFLIHTILQCMSAKRTSWNEFSSSMASAVICLSSYRKFNFSKYIFDSLVRNVDSPSKFYMYPRFLQLIIRKQVGDLLTRTTKYTSPALTQKVFANIRSVWKGFSGVKTPLFEGMLVEQQVAEEGDAEVHGEEVNAGDVAEGNVSDVNDEVPTVAKEHPCHLLHHLLHHHNHLMISLILPKYNQHQPQQDARIPMNLLQEVIDTCTALSRRVEHLEHDKIAQALEIIKLKKKDANVVLKEAKDVPEDAKVDKSVDIQRRQAESQAEIYKIDLEHDDKVLSMQEDESEPAKVQEVVEVVTTAKIIIEVVTAASETITAASITITAAEAQVPAVTLIAAPSRVTAAPSRRREGVVIRDPQEESTTSKIIPAKIKSKDKGKEILAKEDPYVKKYQALKRKPQSEAQARKNMMIYLKNVASFKMDYFKGMSYDDIRPIFEAKFNINVAFLQKTEEQIEEKESRALKRLNETLAEKAAKRKKLDEEVEELKRHLQIVPNEDDDVYTEATLLARKVPVVDYEIIEQNNTPYYKIIRADGTHQLYISFLTLLRNFDREELEALWSLVKERFSTTKPKNYSDDFLLVTLGAMFEKPDIHAQLWKNQRSVHGPAKVKGWKLLESCGVQIITFTTTQLILLVERKYPLTRFTLDQMLNAVRLKVKEESEVSLELLRGIFINQSKYALEMLKKYSLNQCVDVDIPMVGQLKLDEDPNGTPLDPTHYLGMVRSFMYLTASHPGLVFIVYMCARYQAKPTEKHLTVVKRVFWYLKGTINMGLWYPKDIDFNLTSFTDANHAGCQDLRKITSGSAQFLREKLILRMWSQLTNYGFNYNMIHLYSDSQSAIALSCNTMQHSKMNIAFRYHFIREQVENEVVELYFIKTDYQLADIFAKALARERFEFLIKRLGMQSITSKELKRLAKSDEE